MKRLYIYIALPLVIAGFAFQSIATAQTTAGPSEGAAVLFQTVKTKLSAAEKNAVFKNFGFRLAKDKKSFLAPTDEDGSNLLSVTVYATDLNKDATEEIIIEYSSDDGGIDMSGISTALFIKSNGKAYSKACEVDGFIEFLSGSNLGYPDFVVGGPGMSFPVLHWNGRAYQQYKQISSAALEKMKRKSVVDMSKAHK